MCPSSRVLTPPTCHARRDRPVSVPSPPSRIGAVMRIFLAGASGALGSRLVPQLVAAGHTVVGTTRHPGKAGRLRQLGAEPAVLDPLDAAAVAAAVAAAAPDVLVHELTAL